MFLILGHDAAVGFLEVAELQLLDLEIELEEVAGNGHGAASIAGAGFCGVGLRAGFFVVQRRSIDAG